MKEFLYPSAQDLKLYRLTSNRDWGWSWLKPEKMRETHDQKPIIFPFYMRWRHMVYMRSITKKIFKKIIQCYQSENFVESAEKITKIWAWRVSFVARRFHLVYKRAWAPIVWKPKAWSKSNDLNRYSLKNETKNPTWKPILKSKYHDQNQSENKAKAAAKSDV